MTFWDFLRALRANMLVALVGASGSVLAVMGVMNIPGVYSSQVSVVFLLPKTPATPNSLQFRSESLIYFAGLVGNLVQDPGSARSRTTSNAVTLANSGVREGYSVRLPDFGGQWAHNFNTPELVLQVTGPTAEVVQERTTELVARVKRTSKELQRQSGVSAENTIATRLDPEIAPIYYNEGNKKRAAVVTLALGLAATVGLVLLVDGLRRRRRPAQATRSGETAPQIPLEVSAV